MDHLCSVAHQERVLSTALPAVLRDALDDGVAAQWVHAPAGCAGSICAAKISNNHNNCSISTPFRDEGPPDPPRSEGSDRRRNPIGDLAVQVLCPTHDAATIMSAFSINSDQVLRRTAGVEQMPGGATARAVVAPGVTAYTWLGSKSALASR
jgi:hypothetical protein